jgi:PAS domain S-box-containing protein
VFAIKNPRVNGKFGDFHTQIVPVKADSMPKSQLPKPHQSELEGFLGALPTNAVVFDGRGNILAVNTAWQRYSNLGGGSMFRIGQNFFQHKQYNRLHPLFSPDLAQALGRLVRQQTSAVSLERTYKTSLIRFQAKHFLGFSQSLILLQFEEIAMPALQNQHELQTLLEHLPDMVARFDQNCRFLYVSSRFEQWHGRIAAELYQSNLKVAGVADGIAEIWMAAIKDVFAQGLPSTIEYGDQDRYYESRFVPEFNDVGVVKSVLKCSRDITQIHRSNQLIEARERRFRALIENSAEGIALFDPSGTVIYASPSTAQILGYTTFDFVGTDFTLHIHPQDWSQIARAFAQAIEMPNLGVSFTGRFRRSDGVWIWVAGTLTNLLTNPDVEAVVANYSDVTQTHLHAQAIEEKELQYRRLVDNLPNALVAQIDLDLRFSVVGGTMLKNWGSNNDALENKTVSEYLPEYETTYLEQAQNLYRRALAGEVVNTEFSYLDKRIQMQVIPLFENRKIVGATVLALDVSERHQTQLALLESQGLFQNAFDESPTGMIVLQLDGGWKSINKAFATMLGYTTTELYDLSIAAVTHPQDKNNDTLHGLEVTILGNSHYEKRFMHKDGSLVWTRVHFSLVNTQNHCYVFQQVENITAQRNSEQEVQALNLELNNRLDRLSALREIDGALVSSLDLQLTLNLVLDKIRQQCGAQAANVLLYSPESLSLRFFVGRGFRTSLIKSLWVRLGQPLGGLVGLDRTLLVVPNIEAREPGRELSELIKAESVQSYVGLPLLAKGELLGVIELYHSHPLSLNQEMLEFLEILAGQAAIAIDNTRVLRALQYSNTELAMAYDQTIEGWSRALDLRDKETEGHSRRVTEMTVRLARAMDVPESEIVHIRRGALLHDIGKMGIPDEILHKPGKLSSQEWEVMKKHPDYAHELLAPIGFLGEALEIPYAHHEKWDGTGYPRGLRGEQIPRSARIFAIVDVWDALKSDRPYRLGWASDQVIEHLKQGSGTHFDPAVVAAFLRLLNQDQELLTSELENLFEGALNSTI